MCWISAEEYVAFKYHGCLANYQLAIENKLQ